MFSNSEEVMLMWVVKEFGFFKRIEGYLLSEVLFRNRGGFFKIVMIGIY